MRNEDIEKERGRRRIRRRVRVCCVVRGKREEVEGVK